MRRTFTAVLLFTTAVLLALPYKSFAQVGDTLMLYANPNGETIDQQIAADTVGGRNANRVYVLQQTGQTDTVYFVNSIIMSNYNLTIIGKRNPVTGMLPVIAPGFGANGTSPSWLFQAQGGNLTLKNLYITDKNLNGIVTTTGSGTIYITGDSVRLDIDHCVLDGGGVANFLYTQATGDKIFISNTELRNMQYASPYRGGLMFLGKPYYVTDTVSITNCTGFLVNGTYGIGAAGAINYVDFEHNTMFFTGGPVLSPQTNAVVKDNIFYGVNYRGADTSWYFGQRYNGSFNANQMFTLDSLNGTFKSEGFTEAGRKFVIENNAYYWPKAFVSFLDTLKDDTGSAIVPPYWMDSLGIKMFADKNTWPGLTAQNNWEVDPGFNQSYVDQVVDSLMLFDRDYWRGSGSSTHLWGMFQDDPTDIYKIPGHEVPSSWATTQGYPVPENLAYSNDSLQSAGTGHYALGDLNWFPAQLKEWEAGDQVNAVKPNGQQIPQKFELSQNYPNPFNPTTEIQVSLKQSGVMSLKIYNVLGQLVDVVSQGFKPAGEYTFDVNMDRFASGVYFYTLRQGANALTKKMLLLK